MTPHPESDYTTRGSGRPTTRTAGPRPTVRYPEGWHAHIPAELRRCPRWVTWRYVLDAGRGEWTKPPHRAEDPGALASTADPTTWSTFDAALDAALDPRNDLDGVGFVLTGDDSIVGIDLDDCLDEAGNIAAWAHRIVEAIDSYTEVSPSGRGIRILCRGAMPSAGRRTGDIEMYASGRYLTITGDRWPETLPGIEDRTAAIAALCAELFPGPAGRGEQRPGPGRPAAELAMTDREILDRAFRSKHGGELRELYEGGQGKHPSRSEADLALCRLLMFWFGGDVAAIDRVFRSSGRYRAKWDEQRGARTYGETTMEKARARWDGERYAPSAGGGGGDDTGLPRIEMTHEWHAAIGPAVGALSVAPDLYVRGTVLCRAVREAGDEIAIAGGAALRNTAGMVRLVPLSENAIGVELTRYAALFQWAKDKSGEHVPRPCPPPAWLTRAVAELEAFPGLRLVDGITACPFVRPDGSLSPADGYDPQTRTLIAAGEPPDVPDAPTRDDARAAVATLRDLVGDFPFAAEADFATWLAAVLTLVQRPAIPGPAPGFALIGNKAGTGKAKLIDLAGTIATGGPIPETTYTADPVELTKIKVAFAIAGTPVVHLDNVDNGATYGHSGLDSALTGKAPNERILGMSKTTRGVPVQTVWFLSGNNITPYKDAYRRWLPINLNSALERPEERDDLTIRDIDGHARQHRTTYLGACLTILRAYALAGSPPHGKGPLGSFVGWDDAIRACVRWATGIDCLDTQRRAAEESPERKLKLAILHGWMALPGNHRGLTVREAVQLAETTIGDEPAHPGLLEAFRELGRDGKADPKAVGYFVRAMKGAVHDGLMIVEASGKTKAGVRWRVARAEDAGRLSSHGEGGGAAGSGDDGDDTSGPSRAAATPKGDDDDKGDDVPIPPGCLQGGFRILERVGTSSLSPPSSPSPPPPTEDGGNGEYGNLDWMADEWDGCDPDSACIHPDQAAAWPPPRWADTA